MKFKIEEEKSYVINVEKIIRICVEKTNSEEDKCYHTIIYFGKDCYSKFYFPTFEIADRFSNIIQQRCAFKDSPVYTPFIDVIGIQNDLLRFYFKEIEKNKSNDESVYYKSNDIDYES